MRIKGEALVAQIKAVAQWDTEPYEEVAWAVFGNIKAAGNTVEFADILVELDELRDEPSPLRPHLKRVTKLAERARAATKTVVVKTASAQPSPTSEPALELGVEPPLRGQALLAKMGDEPCVRIFVEMASNKGHQSSSVLVARKLLEWFQLRRENVHLKFTLEFVCNGKDALEKAKSMVGGPTLSGYPVTLVELGKSKLVDVNYCLSGAMDRPIEFFPKMHCKNLIALQPYGWRGAAELVMTGPEKSLIMTQGSGQQAPAPSKLMTFPLEFRRLPFTETAAPIDHGAFTPTSLPDRLVAAILDAARSSESTSKPIFVCPIYGMSKGQPMETYGSKIWINVLNALLRLTEHPAFVGNVILLNLSKDLGSVQSGTWGKVKGAFSKESQCAVIESGLSSLSHVNELLSLFTGNTRVAVCTVEGDKHGLVMDRAYRESRLPPIFEGQGSLTQVMCMGRPFLKYSMRAAVDKSNWPSDYLPVPLFDKLDERLQAVCNTIADDWKKDEAQDLAALLWQMLDSKSDVCSYFRRCRQIVTNRDFDRLAWAAEALIQLQKS